MNPIYEKRPEDWARRALAGKLLIRTKGRTKEMHWHDIVVGVGNLSDRYKRLLRRVEQLESDAWDADRHWK